jgi:hypothetical protein
MSDAELAEKFHQCAAWGRLPRDAADAVLDRLWRLENLPDVNELTALLRHNHPAGAERAAAPAHA